MSNKLVCVVFAVLMLLFSGVWVTEVYATPPSPWANQDIGDVGIAGSCDFTDGTFTVDGSGADIGGTLDEFHFVYQTLSGDGSILARLVSVEDTSSSVRVGVMIRKSLEANSAHALMSIFPGFAHFKYRLTTGGTSSRKNSACPPLPYWVKVVRSGDTLTGYCSLGGSVWTQISTQTIAMDTEVYAGLAVCSHDDAQLCTSVFDNVEVSLALPPPNDASEPNPDDKSENVPTDTVLGWVPGNYAADVNAHDIYFGTNFDDVNDANIGFDPAGVYQGSQNKDSNSFDPCGLDCGRAYYWRVDEVNDNDPCIWPGDVWSFMVRCDQAVAGFINSAELLSSISEHWLNDGCQNSINPFQAGWCCGADADHSGGIDFADLALTAKDRLLDNRLGDLQIPRQRVPVWNPGVEGGIRDTNSWPVFCDATHAPYNADGNDANSDVAAINTAINDAVTAGGNQVIYLPAGTFRFDSGQKIYMKSNIVLRGDGWDDTIIKGKGSSSNAAIYLRGGRIMITDVTSDPIPKGTTTITVANATNVSVGDWLYMTQDNDANYMQHDIPSHPGMNTIFKVAAKNGNTITMDRPLRHAFNPSCNPKMSEISPVENAGIEKLRIEMDEDSATDAWSIEINNAVNCWVKEVYCKIAGSRHIFFSYSARNTVFKCMFFRLLKGEQISPWANYSVDFIQGTHDNLVTNTVAVNNHSNLCVSRGASGNVYSYNYHIGITRRKAVQFHGKYPHSNLIEGNDTYNDIMTMDDNWGQQGPQNTIFRNRCTGIGAIKSGIDGPQCDEFGPDLCMWPTGLELNLILNSAYAYYGGCHSDEVCRYSWGDTFDYDFKHTGLWAEYNFARDTTPDSGDDVWGWVMRTPEPTTVRLESDHEGDSAPGHWAGVNFPASLYLTEPPDWWPEGKAWPCIGADIDDHGGTMIKLPAQDWYEDLPTPPWP